MMLPVPRCTEATRPKPGGKHCGMGGFALCCRRFSKVALFEGSSRSARASIAASEEKGRCQTVVNKKVI